MGLDLIDPDRCRNPRLPVEVAQVARERRVVGDPPDVALEVVDMGNGLDEDYEKVDVKNDKIS
jgi:hypothetical protein